MGITERREAEREALRKKIFDAASEIIVTQGYDKLSIRKIAKKIEYSPAVIYNYFKDKAEIVGCIVLDNYNRVVRAIRALELDKMNPEAALRTGLTAFIWLMIENPQQFRAVMMSGIDMTGNNTEATGQDDFQEDDSMSMLVMPLTVGKKEGIFREMDEEMSAVHLLTACFGMISRITNENITGKEVLDPMIDSYVDLLINGLMEHHRD